MHAAVDANCLAAQSGQVYWTYVDYLHAHGQEIMGQGNDVAKSLAALDRIARQEATLGRLDQTILDACLAKQDETVVRSSTKLAADLGIEGTPAVYVNGEKVNGGAVSQNELWIVIDRALRAEGEQPPATPPAAAASPERRQNGRQITRRGLSLRRFRDLSLNAWGSAKPRWRDQLASLIDF